MEGEINNNFENEEGPKKDKLEIIMEEDHNEKYYSTVKKNYNQEKKESINKNTIIKPLIDYIIMIIKIKRLSKGKETKKKKIIKLFQIIKKQLNDLKKI